MGRFDKLYASLPVWAQNAAVTSYGAYWKWLRFGPGYRQYVDEFTRREAYDESAWRRWNQARLGEVLQIAAKHVPYYRRHWTSAEQRAAGRDDRVQWSWVPYGAISTDLKRAVLVAEDIRFFAHGGVDLDEVEDALERAVERKALPRGASTITQQLAKNLWLSGSYNPLRKVKEAILTRQLESRLSKRRILELYLNFAEFGPGIYGAEAAARHYHGRSAARLSERQAAELAAGLPRPRTWHPGVTSRSYQRKVRSIERRMAKARWLRGRV